MQAVFDTVQLTDRGRFICKLQSRLHNNKHIHKTHLFEFASFEFIFERSSYRNVAFRCYFSLGLAGIPVG